MSALERIGSRIRQLRKERGYTLDSMSERIGLTSGKYLGQIERGEVNSTIQTLEKISDGLGVSLEDLLLVEGDESITQIVDLVKGQDQESRERILGALRVLFG